MRTTGKLALTFGFLALLALLWTKARPQVDAFVEALLQCCGAPPPGTSPVSDEPVDLATLRGDRLDSVVAVVSPTDVATPTVRAPHGVEVVSFAALGGFDYVMPDPYAETPTPPTILPRTVLELDGRVVEVEGYMLPIKVVGNRVKSFLLSRYAGGCCFGRSPMMNELVEVEMDSLSPYIPHTVVRVRGRLAVGEAKDEYGYVTSLYRMAGTAVE